MKTNKISNIFLFLCLGLILVMMGLIYNLHTRILSLEEEIVTLKEQKGTGGNRSSEENYDSIKNKDFLTDDNFKEFQKLIIEHVKSNINKMVSEKPVLGGRWIVTEITFLSPDIIEVHYEDGHIGGAIFLKIESAVDSKIVIKPFW